MSTKVWCWGKHLEHYWITLLLKSSPSKANYQFIMFYSLTGIIFKCVRAFQVGWVTMEKKNKNKINITLCKFAIYLANEVEFHKSKMLYRVVGENEVYFCCCFLFSRSPLGEKWERQETDTIASNTWYRHGSHRFMKKSPVYANSLPLCT